MTWGRIGALALAALLAALALVPIPAQAQIRLDPCVAHAGGDALTAPYGPKAVTFTCEQYQSRRGPGDFTAEFRFAPIRPALDDPLVFRMGSVWQDKTLLRFRYADGATREVSYNQANASQYLRMGAIFQIPVPRRTAALTGMEIETRGTANLRGVVLGTALMPRSTSDAMNDWLVALYAGFAGLSLALFAYNLALSAALRHRFQLIYCAMVAAITAYMFTSSGAAAYVFPHIANHDRLRLNYVLLAISGATALWFVRDFFEQKTFPPRLRRLTDGLAVFAVGSAVAFAIAAPTGIALLDRFYFVSLGALVASVVPVMYCAWSNRSRHLGMFVLAWSAPILVSMLRLLHSFGLVPYSFWLDKGNLIALAIEALFSSFLITARLRELLTEVDDARAGEMSALRLANSDPLTGLLNRRAFLDLVIGRGQRYRLMVVDIDHFKDINDRIGHERGDEVLCRVARAIQSVRPADSLAVRLGGEEFGLLVPQERAFLCPPDLVLEAVRCAKMPMELKVTASLGFAEGTIASEEEWKRLYRLADAALYRAKADGRDRATRSTDFQELARA